MKVVKSIKKVIRKDEKKSIPAKSTAKSQTKTDATVRVEVKISKQGHKILTALAEKKNCNVQTLIMEAIKLRYKVN